MFAKNNCYLFATQSPFFPTQQTIFFATNDQSKMRDSSACLYMYKSSLFKSVMRPTFLCWFQNDVSSCSSSWISAGRPLWPAVSFAVGTRWSVKREVQKTYKRPENKLRQHDPFKRPHEIRLICHSAECVLTPQVGIDMDIFDPPITNHI